MTPAKPTMTPRPLGLFSEWYVLVVWPTGKQQQVHGFTNEAHARGWIAEESEAWITQARQTPGH
jgi:hypothetical protein